MATIAIAITTRAASVAAAIALAVAVGATEEGAQMQKTSALLKNVLPLSSGGTIPALGFGVGTAWYKCAADEQRRAELKQSVKAALDAGFTHLDEAELYQNEDATGEALQEWLAAHPDVPRESLFITSKVMSVDHPGGIEAVCRQSLKALGCTYFDLYLIHAPFQREVGEPFATPLPDAWRQMEALVTQGLVRSIGVSNWRVADLEEIYDGATIKPSCNQIEAHPYLQQHALEQWCAERGILVTAYAPLAPLTRPALAGKPVDEPVAAAAAAHGVTPAQVLLRWRLQQGHGAITTTSKPERLQEYLATLSFELTEAEVAAIAAAGAQEPVRLFWTQCKQFDADPRKEPDFITKG